jgi:hypothetical protein
MLRQGRLLHHMTLILAALALARPVLGRSAYAPCCWLQAGILTLGLVETWFAARAALDADLFGWLSSSGEGLKTFDEAMQRLGLAKAGKNTRSLEQRISGATELLKMQGLFLGLQAIVFLAAYA